MLLLHDLLREHFKLNCFQSTPFSLVHCSAQKRNSVICDTLSFFKSSKLYLGDHHTICSCACMPSSPRFSSFELIFTKLLCTVRHWRPRRAVLSNFLQPVITTWRTCELLKWEAPMLDFGIRLGEHRNKCLSYYTGENHVDNS